MLYLFSGLGADKRVFQYLNLNENHKFIEWTIPKHGESLIHYANRIIEEQIDNQSDVKIVGVSFGGIVGIEVAKILKLKKIILISSAKTYLEIPLVYRIFGKLKLDAFLPSKILKWANPISYFFFGVEKVEDKKLLKAILTDTNSIFLKWAIREIMNWQNEEFIKNTIHLHGTKDRILPHRSIKNVVLIPNGGHFMIFNKAEEINKLIFN